MQKKTRIVIAAVVGAVALNLYYDPLIQVEIGETEIHIQNEIDVTSEQIRADIAQTKRAIEQDLEQTKRTIKQDVELTREEVLRDIAEIENAAQEDQENSSR